MAATNEQVARKWAAVTFKKFRSEIIRLKIGKSGNLSRSFQAFVQAEAGGDSVKIRLLYALYGKFRDMGVGKGKRLGLGSNKTVTKLLGGSGKGRAAKKWYSKTIAKETFILAEILQTNAGQKAVSVLDKISSTVILEM